MVGPTPTFSESFIKTIFLLLGIGILLPWNAFISAKQYFVSRLCDLEDDGDNYHDVREEIEMWFSIVYNGAGVLSLVVVILVQHLADGNRYQKRMRSVKSFIFKNTTNLSVSMMSNKASSLKTVDTRHSTDHSIWYMVIIPLAVYLLVFAISTILVFFTSIPTQFFIFVTLWGLFICGVSTAIASSGIVGTAGLFPADIGVNPFFNGQAIGGLIVACANFVASFLDGQEHFLMQYCVRQDSIVAAESPETNGDTICIPYGQISYATAGYFSMGGFILAACMIGYNFVDRYKRLVRKSSFGVKDRKQGSSEKVEIDVSEYDDNEQWSTNEQSLLLIEGPISHTSNSYVQKVNNHNNGLDQVQRQNSVDTEVSAESTQSVTVSVWTSIWGTALSLFFTYFCTLAVFPVWTSELVSASQCTTPSRLRNDLFVPLSFVIFNGGDLVGRYISSAIEFEKISNLSSKLVWASVARIFVFFFLFLLCQARRNRWMVVESDMYSWSIQFFFAVTNGVLTNVAFCYAPTLVENRTKPQQVASAILNLALTLGLTVGSFFSVPFLKFALGEWLSW